MLRLGEDGQWDLAHIKRNAGVFAPEQQVEHPEKFERGEGCLIAIPSHLSLCVALWLSTEDKSLYLDMVRFQLEKRGLIGPNELIERRLKMEPVLTENGRTLIMAVLLHEPFPEDLVFIDAKGYELTASSFPIPRNSAALWHEGDRLVLACRRGENLAAVQTFNGREIEPMVAGEIGCVLLELLNTGVLPEIGKIKLWGRFSDEDLENLRMMWDGSIEREERPGLMLPQKTVSFIPERVDYLRRMRLRGKRLFLFAAAGIGIYLLILLFMVAQFVKLKWDVNSLESALAENQAEVDLIERTQRGWEAMLPAIEPSFYSVENLLQASKPLPPEGVRFTLFQNRPGSIMIRGEAKSFREAQAYFQKLQRRPELQNFTFTLADPRIEADGRASFQIEGVREGYAATDQ
jgi:hypothetical protein